MLGILFVIPCLCFLALFVYFEHKENYLLAVIFKGLASLSFLACALYNYLTNSFSALNEQLIQLVIIGLSLGVVGDVFLNLRFVVKQKISNPIFLFGVFAFLAGHILYLVTAIKILQTNSSLDTNLIYIPAILSLLVTAAVSYLIFKLLDAKLANKIVGILYILTITTVVFLSSFIFFDYLIKNAVNNFYLLLFIGSCLFMASDVVLIFNSFGKHPKFPLRICNLSLYYVGQLLIAISIIFLQLV